MLRTKRGSGQSMDCPAHTVRVDARFAQQQSMDCLRKLRIHALRNTESGATKCRTTQAKSRATQTESRAPQIKSQAPKTKGTGRNRRKGLPSIPAVAAATAWKDAHIHCDLPSSLRLSLPPSSKHSCFRDSQLWHLY